MKTKQVPAIVMLTAGFITCIISIFEGLEADKFLKILFVVLICFYILGGIIKFILDKNFGKTEEQKAAEEAEGDTAQEEQKAENTADKK